MPILVECDVCGKKYRVGDERAGSTIECKECFADIHVPGTRRIPTTPPRSAAGVPRSPVRSAPKKSGINPLLIVGGIIGGFMLLGIAAIAVVVFIALRAKNAPNPQPVAAPPNFARPDIPQPPPFPNQFPPNMPRPPQPVMPPRVQPFPNFPQPPVTELIAWNVEIDPPKETYEFDPAQEIRIPVDERYGDRSLLIPDMPTAFALVGRNASEREQSAVYDLRTGEKIADVGGIKLDPNLVRLGRDGKYLVGRPPFSKELLVYDVEANKPLGRIPLTNQYTFMKTLAIPGSNRLVAGAGNAPLMVWSLPSGDVQHEIELPRDSHQDSVAFSPGGRYAALIHDGNKKLRLYDLDSGQPAGEVAAPLGDHNWADRPETLAFSPDGVELAGLFGSGSVSRLVVWDVASGKQVHDHKFEQNLRHSIPGANRYQGSPLEWFPDRSQWLVYGHGIVDRKAGGLVWSAPVDPVGPAARRVLDAGRVLTITGPRNERVVAPLMIPREEVE